jgi:hypothetical protein
VAQRTNPGTEGVMDFLSEQELRRVRRADPTQTLRRKQRPSSKDQQHAPTTNNLEEDEPSEPDHPQRDS